MGEVLENTIHQVQAIRRGFHENAITTRGGADAAPTIVSIVDVHSFSSRTNSIRLGGAVHPISLNPLLPFNIDPMNVQVPWAIVACRVA